jgi:peptide-methionine (S)-S-oxide reductase
MASSDPISTSATRTVLAGGCFWGLQHLLRQLPGVVHTRVGYTGGHLPNPRYDDTHDSKSGHAEAVEVMFDPARISYRTLLLHFFQIHDPTTLNRQGNDRGTQYRSAIFYADAAQQEIAVQVIAEINQSGRWPGPAVTTLEPLSVFYEAEPEHQDYLQHYPNGYTCHWVRPDWVP